MLRKFTILLLYPDYVDDFPQTWCGYVEAEDLVRAVEQAQTQCAEGYRKHEDGSFHPGDLYPLAIFPGEHMDIIGAWAAEYNSGLERQPPERPSFYETRLDSGEKVMVPA